MKRLLIFLICSVIAFSSLSCAFTAVEIDLTGEAADLNAADTPLVQTAATMDELAPTGYSIPGETAFLTKINALRTKYPNGSVWEGVYYEDGMAKAWTCFAYAVQMMREIFGVKYYAERIFDYMDYNYSGISAGDIVRIDGDSHSIFIIKITQNGYYYTDGNGTGVTNQIRWDGYLSNAEMKSRFTYKVHLPGNTLRGNGVVHTMYYSGNGGSGSVASVSVGANQSFSIKSSGFTRSGYDFAGYTVRRNSDNLIYTTDAGWKTQAQITENGYHCRIYKPGENYTMSTGWTGNTEAATNFTFYAQWLQSDSTVEYFANYSGYNYLLGSDLGSSYSKYIYARDTSNYTLSIDNTNRLNNVNTLKIVGKSAGKAGSDMEFITSTNKGYCNGYSPAAAVGDKKTFYLRFYAKSSVNGAKMYLRWGNSATYQSVTLTTYWQIFTVALPKNQYFNYALYPYFDKAGTFYLNSLTLSDNANVTNVVPETAVFAASARSVKRGYSLDYMPTPQRSGYVFSGWYTAAEGGSLVTTETPIKASAIRLYAHWRKDISYTPVKTVKYNGHIYELYDNSLRWLEAAMFCSVKGGHLVSVGDRSENLAVYNMISDRQGFCWIGLYCSDKKTTWKWMDNTPYPGYSNWYDSNYGAADTDEDYALMHSMYYVGRSAGSWDKSVGSSSYCSYYGYQNSFFICEYDDPDLLGDSNGDRNVDVLDATLIQRSTVGAATGVSEDVLIHGDVNENGVLETIDASLVQQYSAKMNVPYEIDFRIKS